MSTTKIKKTLEQPSIANAPVRKKIGFISSIMLVIGSSVGAGIFIKNWNIINNTGGALFFSILSWMIAIIGIMALALTLIEICSGSGEANSQGIIGWVREFNGKVLYRASKNFMAYLHIPIICVMMPIYMVMVSQQAFGYEMPWWGCALITLGLGMYHIWFVGFFSKVANISNWVVSSIEFIPLLFACGSGFIVLATNGLYDNASFFISTRDPDSPITSFVQLNLMLGVLNSIPAVFFSFDGFYSAAGLQTEMKEPRKMPKALTIGVSIVAAFEIFVSTSLLIGCQDGSLFGLSPENSPFPLILVQFMMVCVLIGMLSVITGSAVYAPRFYESLILHDEIPFFGRWKNRLSNHQPVVGSVIASILFLIVFSITFTIGTFAFWDVGGYSNMASIVTQSNGDPIYIYNNGSHMATILSFVDTYGNWNALFAFVCVTFAIFGCLRNRFTHKVKTTKSKVFVPSAIIAILIVGVGILFVFINTFADFSISLTNYINHPGAWFWDVTNPDVYIDTSTNLIGSITAIVVLVVFCCIMFVPSLVMKNKPLYNAKLKH